MEEQDNNNIKVNAMLLRAMKHLESNRNDGMDVQTMMIETTTTNTKRGGNHRLRERKGTIVDSSYSALASQSASKKTSTKSLSKVTLNELKQRARKAREGYVLSEKAILAGGDRETKFGYCLMYLNAIQKSVNDMCLGGVHFDERRHRRRYPWEAFDEPDDEDDLEKKRVKRKKQNEEREREKKLKKKKEETTLNGKEVRGGGVMIVVEEEDAKALAPLTTMANAKSPRKRGAEGGEENVVVDDERTTTNKKPTMAVKIIKPGRYPGEYCQLCGEHEHMVHVKYESQVLGEGKLVCYGCLVKEKKELEKKQKELTSAKERQKRKELTKAARRKRDETITVTSPMTTPNTTTTHSYSSPVSGAPNAVALPQQQSSSSPISEADVLVVDGETVTPTATTRTTDVALHTAEKIEAIHDISIVCDRCGKDSFRAAGELERHKTTQCIIAKTSEVIISDSLIETAVTTTTTSENEEAKQGERDGDNVGKIIVANAIANIISEEGEANEKQQQDDTREIREEAFVERLREQNLSREEVKNEELIDEEEERGKEETTVFVDVNTAADVPRKGCQSSSHKSEKRRELPLAEILHIAKDGFPFTKHASSGNISPPSVVISDSVHENTINTIEPANLEQEERRRKAPVSPLDENKEDKKKRLSGPSMKESDERVREMKEWRTENVHALHHGY